MKVGKSDCAHGGMKYRRDIDGKRFSIIEFYRRRVNRIFPALSAVLIVSLVFGWITLFPDEYRSLGKNMAASAFFAEDLYLCTESGYSDADSVKKPFLHIWIICVEGQFYIIYPVILRLSIGWGFLASDCF